jgi:hypothetical protein
MIRSWLSIFGRKSKMQIEMASKPISPSPHAATLLIVRISTLSKIMLIIIILAMSQKVSLKNIQKKLP